MRFPAHFLSTRLQVVTALSAVFIAGLPLTEAYAQPGLTGATQPLPKISVSATGSSELAPDIAIMTMTVRTEEKAARSALTANNESMANVLAALNEYGIAAADMQTSGFSISPRIRYPNDRQPGAAPETVGYTVQNTLTVRVRDLSSVGEILDKSVSLGVNRGGSIRFANSKPDEAITQARIEAVTQARAKAKTLADAAGVGLGPILHISEQSRQPHAIPMMQAARSVSADSSAVPIESGENTYRVSVSIDWQIDQ